MIMKTYILQNMIMACIVICFEVNCLAQADLIAINEKNMFNPELLDSKSDINTPVKIIDFCLDDIDILGRQIFDLGLESKKYVVGIVKDNIEEKNMNQKGGNIFARTFKRNGNWFLEFEDLDATNFHSIGSHCIKLMVYNKQHNQ